MWPVHASGLSLAPAPSHSPLRARLPARTAGCSCRAAEGHRFRPPFRNAEKGPQGSQSSPLAQCLPWASAARIAYSGTVKENLRQGSPTASPKQRAGLSFTTPSLPMGAGTHSSLQALLTKAQGPDLPSSLLPPGLGTNRGQSDPLPEMLAQLPSLKWSFRPGLN